MTQRALVAYSVGLMGLMVKVLAPGFYSRQDIKTPVKIAIITLIMTCNEPGGLSARWKHAVCRCPSAWRLSLERRAALPAAA